MQDSESRRKRRRPHPDAAGIIIHWQIAAAATLPPYNRLI
jgi:hypothetical protein